jgi:hypothetical protein
MKTLEVRLDPKTIAKKLVSLSGGRKEAINTIVEGSHALPAGFGNLLFNIAQQVPKVCESQDAYRFVHYGKTRKGGSPGIKRYL